MSPTHHLDVLSWASEIDENTMAQAQRTAAMPFVEKPLALMPDAHFGFGSTVGSVIATRGAIMPAAVGVDIGCGMLAVETDVRADQLPDNLGPMHGRIREAVPAGMGKGHEVDSTTDRAIAHHFPSGLPSTSFTPKQAAKTLSQFGTLGGGNHFIEVCLDERDLVWVVLHSGSRGIGNELANIHIEGAKGNMKRRFIDLADLDLAYLVEGEDDFKAYIADMLWAQDYAMGNREAMMDAVLAALNVDLPTGWREVSRINTHHNYTEREHHRGHDAWLTRKGAIRARLGDRGIIPGSMGTKTFIVTGLGNPASYHSCSHGAGRRLSRGRAHRELDVAGLRTAMEGKTWNDRDAEALLDEDPRAYKDVDQVMADQADLVSIDHELRQVLNYKGIDSQRRKGRR